MLLPPTVETKEEFEEYEKCAALPVEKFDLLMRSIRVNHKFIDGMSSCVMCMQELPYLVYTRQVACHFKKRYDELKQQQQNQLAKQ
jgi:hypothetical protein